MSAVEVQIGYPTDKSSQFDGGHLSRKIHDGDTFSSRDQINGRIHQSASDFNLPSLGQSSNSHTAESRDGVKRVYSLETSSKSNQNAGQGPLSPSRRAQRLQKAGQVTVSSYTLPESPAAKDLAQLPKALAKNSKTVSDDKPKASRSLVSLARRGSWIVGSRSPSPSKRKLFQDGTLSPQRSGVTNSPAPATQPEVPEEANDNDKSLPRRRPTSSSPRSRRPLSAILTRSKSTTEEPDSHRAFLPRSISTDRLPLREQHSNIPEMPSLPAKERYQTSGVETPRKKDELWGVFRSLDGDFHKFSTKPSTLKANAIRTTLLPSLRSHADHPSWKRLRPEDLDRRANILNKWWTGLLEMLNGRNGHSVSASDRPAVLEGIGEIMARPEWRIPLSAISAVPPKSGLRSKSSSSLESNISDFLAESVIHNVRNIFVQNLLSQMAFVAERMSMRSVPASIVIFCGKAAAYAFVFCPGVADILVRLWGLQPGALRRVLEEHGHARNASLSDSAEASCQSFPQHLHSLAFSSVAKMARQLRSTPASPLNSAYIAWDGPWKSRWAGKDSDLFFCFVKQFHILACGMLPENASADSFITAPCAMLVQAQLLVVMEDTIHRAAHDQHPEPFDGPLPITFDDVLGADASALSVTSPAPNSARLMAENRLIMLLRDFLSIAPTISDQARSSFANIFERLLKATAKRISLYDHNACFTLCDFLEEAIAILSRYHAHPDDPGAFLDWNFWLQVLKQMGESNNSTTDMRLYAFVYSLWGYIAKDPERKKEVCLNWLLKEDYALRQFCHWCPMVRAYYMRLLCWRIVRFDGRATETDVLIYRAAYQRLRNVWAHFLFLQRQASERKDRFLSTAPAHPAPQRRFLIIRNDSSPAQPIGFLSFDTMAASTSSGGQTVSYNASVDSLRQLTAASEEEPRGPMKKRWSTLRGLNPFSGSSKSNEDLRQSSSSRASKRPTNIMAIDSPSITPPQQSPSQSTIALHSQHSFKFSLEWQDRSLVPRERKLFPPILPGPTQMHLYAMYPELAPPKPNGVASSTQSPPINGTANGNASGTTDKAPADAAAAGWPLNPSPPRAKSRPPPPHLTRSLPPPRGMEAVCRYSGSALAEWSVLVTECQSFCERRRAEGVPEIGMVETPTLGVEPFKRPVG